MFEEFKGFSSLTVGCMRTQLFSLLSHDSRLIYLLFKYVLLVFISVFEVAVQIRCR